VLRELRVGNLALAEDVAISLTDGLTMLTGETGAGKSLIAGALGLLAGGKGDRGLIRHDEDVAFVEGVFDLADRPGDLIFAREAGLRLGEDGILVLRRELKREGRGRVFINGLLSSLALLEQLGGRLLSIQSQDQQRQLSAPRFAGDFLDRALGLEAERAAMETALSGLRAAAEDLRRRRDECELARQQLDIWRYQHTELSQAGLEVEEEAQLTEELAVGRNFRKLVDGASAARLLLSEGDTNVRQLLGRAEGHLGALAGDSQQLSEVLDLLQDATAGVGEATSALERFLDRTELDPARLDELETRRSLYAELCRKYNRDVDQLVALEADLAQRIARQDGADADLKDLQETVADLGRAAVDAAEDLRAKRVAGAPRVAEDARVRIAPLALPDIDFRFEVEPETDPEGELTVGGAPCRATARGADRVTLLARTNKGEAPGPVGQIASGGERSRIFLGLSVMSLQGTERPLMLFDEIDAGLGMDNAVPVARLLEELARNAQVLCITHLPTVAARGDAHLVVEKAGVDGRTSLSVTERSGEGRVAELARLLGGQQGTVAGSASQAAYARELLGPERRAGRG